MEHLAPEPDQCLPHLDVLRGFALFGILLVNFEWFSRSTQAMLLGSSSDLQGLDYRVTFADFSFFWMPMVLGYFLFGRWLVESGIMERPDQHGPWMRRWQVRGLMLGLPASLAAMSLMRDAHLHLPDLQLTLGLLLYLVGSVGLSLAYLILVTRHAGRLQFLAPVGRMALTNYLLQSLFWTTIFYGYGFGWWGQIPRALHVPLALLFFTGQILWSRWWMARHHHGPMEWLWRVLTRLGRQSRKPGEHKIEEAEKRRAGFPTRQVERDGGQECPLSGVERREEVVMPKHGEHKTEEAEKRRAGFPTRQVERDGGQECPPSGGGAYFNPRAEIDQTRHHLPHWQQGEAWVFVTWRQGDSLPKAKLDQWKTEREAWMRHHPEPWDEKTESEYHDRFSRQIDEWLDQGSGSCVLKDPANAKIVADALRHFHGSRYEIATFVVMPNHVHVLFRPLGGHALPDILKSWKGFTAREIKKRIGKSGSLWQDDYWDRLIRNERHFFKVAEYIRENPVKEKLRPGEYLQEGGLSSPPW